MINLYEVERNSVIDVSHINMIVSDTGEKIEKLNFHRVDGMYSICYTEDGELIHLSAMTKVKVLSAIQLNG